MASNLGLPSGSLTGLSADDGISTLSDMLSPKVGMLFRVDAADLWTAPFIRPTAGIAEFSTNGAPYRPHAGSTAGRPRGKCSTMAGSTFMVWATMPRGVWANQSKSDTSEK